MSGGEWAGESICTWMFKIVYGELWEWKWACACAPSSTMIEIYKPEACIKERILVVNIHSFMSLAPSPVVTEHNELKCSSCKRNAVQLIQSVSLRSSSNTSRLQR